MVKIVSAGRLLILSALVAVSLSADTSYAIQSGTTDSGGNISGTVDFSVNCTTSCALNVLISGAEANPTDAAQLISGIEFDLTDPNPTGALSVGSSSVLGTMSNGSGGAVNEVDANGNVTSTTITPSRWGVKSITGGFDLTTLTGGQPADLIIGGSPYTNMNSSIQNFSPSLVGPVDFTITGIAGLNSTTVVSAVKILMGTTPDAIVTQLNCSGNCGGPILNQGGSGPSTPEPFSFLLAGSALGAFALIRRRVRP